MLLAVLRLVVVTAQLQLGGATVTGVVRDAETEQPLVGAVVVMTDEPRSALTDAKGRYVLRDVTAGPHQLSIRALGFASRTLHVLAPTTGLLDLHVSLAPRGTRLATLVVRPTPERRIGYEGARSRDERLRTIDEIRSSPFAVAPDILLTLTGGTVRATPESPDGLHLRGGATDHVAYALDGLPVFSPYHAAGMFSAWNPDAIDAVALRTATASAGDLAALSGTVQVTSRAPGDVLRTRGVVNTTHVGLSVDGPLGVGDLRLLLSARAGYPAAAAPLSEASYVRGGTGDRMLALDASAFGGRLHVTGYDAEDEISVSSVVDTLSPTPAAQRSAFDWHSRTIGAEWTRRVAFGGVRLLSWSARGDARAMWAALGGPSSMSSSRRDVGLLVSATQRTLQTITTSGVRVEHSRTGYQVNTLPETRPLGTPDGVGDSSGDFTRDAAAWLATAFATNDLALRTGVALQSALSVAVFGRRVYTSPRVELRWQAAPKLTVHGSVARRHQFAQSVRNAESVVGNVFPADLYLGAGVRGTPVAQSTNTAAGVAYQPTTSTHIGVQAYRAQLNQIVLVAANEVEPFATHRFDSGRGTSRGVTIDATLNTPRLGVVLSYLWQRVSYATDGVRYVPSHAASHVFQGGINLHATSTTSIRLGVVGEAGRRASVLNGPFEWESCNLRDRGCEFGGSPRIDLRANGTAAIPLYARADLGVRKHWIASIRQRQTEVAVYGTITNLLGRSNVLTYSRAGPSNALAPVDMRPFAPLVLGMEWHF